MRSSSDVFPTNTVDLGTSSNRWDTIYGAAGNFSGVIVAGSTSTTGGSWLEKNYSGANKINVLSSHYSNGNTVIGYGAKGKASNSGYVATYGNFSGNKSVLELAADAFYFKVTDSAAQDTIGDDITLNTRLAVDKDGMTYTSSNGTGLLVKRTSVTGYLQFYPAYSSVPTIMGKGAGGLHLGYNSSSSGIRIDTSNNVIIKDNILFFGSTSGPFVSNDSTVLRLAGDGGVKIQTYVGGWQDRLTIIDDGNVGIGTTQPSQKLDVNGNTELHGTLTIANNNTLSLGTTGNNTGTLRLFNNNSTAYYLDYESTGARAYRFHGSSSGGAYTTTFNQAGTGGHNVSIDGNLSVTGTSTFQGSLDLQDNDKILLGSGNDLEIYHDGSNSYIKDTGTGNLVLNGSQIWLKNAANSANMIGCVEGSYVKLYHNGNEKLATASTGVSVTGNLSASGTLDVNGSGQQMASFGNTSARCGIEVKSSQWCEVFFTNSTYANSARIGMAYDSSHSSSTENGDWYVYQPNVARMDIIVRRTGNVILCGAGGASAGKVGIGTTNPSASLHVGNSTTGTEPLRLQKSDDNNSNHVTFYMGTTRMGEIGCKDTTWLRINQDTAKDIYTQRMFRSDGGFQVDGAWVIDANGVHSGSGAQLTSLNASNIGSGTVPLARMNKVLPTSGNYVWSQSTTAGNYTTGLQCSFVRSSDGWPSYGSVLHVGARGGTDAGGDFQIYCGHGSGSGGNYLRVRNADNNASPTDSWTDWRTIWDSGNDGSGSGLDADLLDGNEGSYYRNANNLNAGTVPAARLGSGSSITTKFLRGDNTWQTVSGGSGTVTSVATSGAITGGTITTSGTISHSTANGYKHIPSNGANGQFLRYSSAGTAAWASGLLDHNNFIHFVHRTSDGTGGGQLTGNMLNTRTLNTVLTNNAASNGGNKFAYLGGVESPYNASSNNNKIIMTYTGTYYCQVFAHSRDVAEMQVMLINDTADTILVNGYSAENASYSYGWGIQAEGTFTISGTNSGGALSSVQTLYVKQWANETGSTSSANGSGNYTGGRPLSAGTSSPSPEGASASPFFDEYGYDTYVSIVIWKVG